MIYKFYVLSMDDQRHVIHDKTSRTLRYNNNYSININEIKILKNALNHPGNGSNLFK